MSSFIDELKKRKVFRVGALYLVVAWLLLQLTDLVFENLNAPDWVMQAIMLVLAIGFPLALLLAWAFEVTPEGIKSDESASSTNNSRLFYLLVSLLAIAGIAFFIFRPFGETDLAESKPIAETGAQAEAESEPESDDSSYLSIAVLPFESLSEDKADQYFADGLADTLLHKLATLETLTVIARNSSFQFKGQNVDVREIGEKLGVPTLLEGTVQRQGEQVRVIAQLVNTRDGAHWWSETFDDTFENIFDLQDRIAAAIAEQLQINLSDRDHDRLYRKGTTNPEAYETLVRARAIKVDYDAAWDPAIDTRLNLLKQVVEIDPEYALGWADLSSYYDNLVFLGVAPARSDEFIEEARLHALKAIEVDSQEPAGYVELGSVYRRTFDMQKAAEAYRQALALSPNDAGALSGLGLSIGMRNPAEGLELFQRAQEIDPDNAIVWRQIYLALSTMGRIDEGRQSLEEGIRNHPNFWILYEDLAGVYQDAYGQIDKAVKVMSDYFSSNPTSRTALSEITEYWLEVNDLERAQAWLDALTRQYPDQSDTIRLQALLAAWRNDFAGSLESARAIPGNDLSSVFGRGLLVLSNCLHLGDSECVQTQVNQFLQLRQRIESQGSSPPPGVLNVFTIMQFIVEHPDAETATDALAAMADNMKDWPFLLGGPVFSERGYRRAMALALLDQTAEAVAEMEDAIGLPEDGFLASDFSGMPPGESFFLQSLHGSPEFTDWLERFNARRTAMRERMIEMEASGEIVSAP